MIVSVNLTKVQLLLNLFKGVICIVISAMDDRYLVCDDPVHESPSLRLRRGVKIYKIKTIKLNISTVGLSQCQDLGT